MTRAGNAAPPVEELPIFSERLKTLLEEMFRGEAPNSGRFCGNCYTPMARDRMHCPHCRTATADRKPLEKVPRDVLLMFRSMQRRESLVVNSYAYAGLFLAVLIFLGIFTITFYTDGRIGWYIFDIVFLFVLARVLAGLLGGYVGDEIGYKYAQRKLAEEWRAWEQKRDAPRTDGDPAT